MQSAGNALLGGRSRPQVVGNKIEKTRALQWRFYSACPGARLDYMNWAAGAFPLDLIK